MAKRFTDTDKWKKPFIRSLKAPYKLLWFYICDDCDHAGIWQVDMDVAIIRIGEKVNIADAKKFFDEKIIILDNGNKWFIPSFIDFQYPSGLNPTNKAHIGVINILKKYNLIDNEFKPLTSPLQGAMDMDKDKDKEMDKDMEEDKVEKIEKKEQINAPQEWLELWNFFKEYKKSKGKKYVYKDIKFEQIAFDKLVKLSDSNLEVAKKIVEQTIANNWDGLFELKNPPKQNNYQPSNIQVDANYNRSIEEMRNDPRFRP